MTRSLLATVLMLATVIVPVTNTAPVAPSYAAPLIDPEDDPDAAAEQASAMWSSALDPQGRDLTVAVAKALRAFNDQDYKAARATLQTAQPSARDDLTYWRLHAAVAAMLNDWPTCLASYRKAFARIGSASTPLRKGWLDEVGYATCLANVGQIGQAEEILQRVTNRIPTSGEKWQDDEAAWLMQGELFLELGRINDATMAFKTLSDALRTTVDFQAGSRARWWWAMTLDRTSRIVAAQKAITEVAADQQREVLAPRIPALFAANDAYMRGLAAESSFNRNLRQFGGRSSYAAAFENAIASFREFKQLAPTSPWRSRADEHVAALEGKLPTRLGFFSLVEKKPGTVDAEVRRALPQLRRCSAAAPRTVFRVIITTPGPPRVSRPELGRTDQGELLPTRFAGNRTAGAATTRSTRPPSNARGAANTRVAVSVDYPGDDIENDALEIMFECLRTQAAAIGLPAATEPGINPSVTFAVIGNAS